MIKNQDYYDSDAISLDGLRFQVIKDSQQAVLANQTDQLDFTNISGEQVTLFSPDSEFRSAEQGYMWFISPNQLNENIANVDLRLAIDIAFDREVIKTISLKMVLYLRVTLFHNY